VVGVAKVAVARDPPPEVLLVPEPGGGARGVAKSLRKSSFVSRTEGGASKWASDMVKEFPGKFAEKIYI